MSKKRPTLIMGFQNIEDSKFGMLITLDSIVLWSKRVALTILSNTTLMFEVKENLLKFCSDFSKNNKVKA